MGYGHWLHGEAVSAGIAMAMDTSKRLELIDEQTQNRGLKILERAGLPITPPSEMSADIFMRYMSRDKKVLSGNIRLILLDAIGKSHVSQDFDPTALHRTLAHFCD